MSAASHMMSERWKTANSFVSASEEDKKKFIADEAQAWPVSSCLLSTNLFSHSIQPLHSQLQCSGSRPISLQSQLLCSGSRSISLQSQLLCSGSRSISLQSQLLCCGSCPISLQSQLLCSGSRSISLQSQLLCCGSRPISLQSQLLCSGSRSISPGHSTTRTVQCTDVCCSASELCSNSVLAQPAIACWHTVCPTAIAFLLPKVSSAVVFSTHNHDCACCSASSTAIIIMCRTLPRPCMFCTDSLPPPPLYRFRPSLPVAYVSRTLAFPSPEECVQWLSGLGLPVDSPSQALDCKTCLPLVQAAAST